MIEVQRSTTADVDRVWSFLGDVERWPTMLPTFRQVTRVRGDGPIGVGDRFEVAQPGLAKATYEITEWDAGRAFVWASKLPGVITTATHRLEPGPDGTRLVLTISWSGPLAWLIRLLYWSKSQRMVELEADTFVRLAEDGASAD